jgi:hypothetical protein
MAHTKQTARYQSKEDLRRIDELHGRTIVEPTDPVPDTPVSIDTTVPAAVLPTAGTSFVVTTITTTGLTSVSTIIDQSGTNTIIIISTVVPGINIESRNDTSPAAVASTQQVIDIELDSSDDKVETVPDPKRLKTNKY